MLKMAHPEKPAMPVRRLLARIAFGWLLTVAGVLPLGAMELITEAEAKLPDDNSQVRGLSRGPQVSLVNPAPTAGLIRAPFNLKVKFEAFGGARVDTDSVVITYKKVPAIDLTQRVKTFIDTGGVNVEGVQVPPGEHRIRVDVADSGGRKGWTEFVIRVAQ
jgi:hypothetical protein